VQLLNFAVFALVCLLQLLGVHAVDLCLEELHGENDFSNYDNLRDSDANTEAIVHVVQGAKELIYKEIVA
jgi:hypothetical protein